MNRQTSKDSNPALTKKESTETPTSPASASDSDGGGYGNDTVSRPSNFSSYADYTSRDVSEDIDDEDPPPLSERIATYHDDEVTFRIIILNSFYNLIQTLFRTYRKTLGKFSSTREKARKRSDRMTMMKINDEERSKSSACLPINFY